MVEEFRQLLPPYAHAWMLVTCVVLIAVCVACGSSKNNAAFVPPASPTVGTPIGTTALGTRPPNATPRPTPAPTAPATPPATPSSAGPLQTLPGGLQYQDLVVGTGATASANSSVTVNYTGWLLNGTKFDSSLDRHQAATFQLGQGKVIKGWDEGLPGMKVGGMRRLIIPPDLGYGAQGQPPTIPPNATLIFDVELLGVQ